MLVSDNLVSGIFVIQSVGSANLKVKPILRPETINRSLRADSVRSRERNDTGIYRGIYCAFTSSPI